MDDDDKVVVWCPLPCFVDRDRSARGWISACMLRRRFVVIRTGSFSFLNCSIFLIDSFDSKSSLQANDSFDSIAVTDWRRTYREVEVRIPMTSPVYGPPHLES
jgi:hypothetical protein